MTTIPYEPSIKVHNLQSLSGGTGCKYLVVLVGHNGQFIAHSWKRKPPANLTDDYAVIEFSPRSK